MSAPGVVLDACVLIPAALRDMLLRSARHGLYQPYWSEMILAEVERNLSRSGLVPPDKARTLAIALRTAFPQALIEGFEPLIPRMTNHPKDRHVAAAAVTAGAKLIVTFNLRDFPHTASAPYGIDAWHPDSFLLDLVDQAPELMVLTIEQQAAALRNPPKGYHDILDNLTGQVPRFAATMREQQTSGPPGYVTPPASPR